MRCKKRKTITLKETFRKQFLIQDVELKNIARKTRENNFGKVKIIAY